MQLSIHVLVFIDVVERMDNAVYCFSSFSKLCDKYLWFVLYDNTLLYHIWYIITQIEWFDTQQQILYDFTSLST